MDAAAVVTVFIIPTFCPNCVLLNLLRCSSYKALICSGTCCVLGPSCAPGKERVMPRLPFHMVGTPNGTQGGDSRAQPSVLMPLSFPARPRRPRAFL